jgi:hypothetical protein
MSFIADTTVVSPLHPATVGEPSPIGQVPVIEPAPPEPDTPVPVESGTDGRALDSLVKNLKKAQPEPVEPPRAAEPDPKPEEASDPMLDKARELFEDVKLPEGAKPKSSEAFSLVKERASAEVAKAFSENAKLREELDSLKAQVEKPVEVDPKLLSEVEELRKFRAAVDIETHPEVTKFNEQKANIERNLYEGFAAAGTSKDVLDDIRKYGGFSEVDLSRLIASLPDSVHKTGAVAKLAELGFVDRDRKEKLESLKSEADKIVSKRKAEYEAEFATLNERINRRVESEKQQIPWLHEKPVPPTATPEDKLKIEAHNAKAVRASKELEQIVKETSDEARVAGAFALVYVGLLQDQIAAEQKVFKDRTEASTKRITELETQLASIRQSSRRLPSAIDTGAAPAAAPAIKLDVTDGQALDLIAKRFAGPLVI